MKVLTFLPLLALSVLLAACAPADVFDRTMDDPDNEPPMSEAVNKDLPKFEVPAEMSAFEEDNILNNYANLDPQRIVPTNLLKKAVLFYNANSSKLANKRVLAVIDFSRPSSEKRLFIVNMQTGNVLAFHVAHGKGSDRNGDGIAERFSNSSGSNASSLGYYMAAETYYGKHGLSLRLDGLSSTNSNARRRAVVIHGATYVKDKNIRQGRSWGCPAISMANRDKVINLLKNGALIYADLAK